MSHTRPRKRKPGAFRLTPAKLSAAFKKKRERKDRKLDMEIYGQAAQAIDEIFERE